MGAEWTVRPLEECVAALIDYRGKVDPIHWTIFEPRIFAS